MEDIVAQHAEVEVKKKSHKKLLVISLISLVFITGLFYIGYLIAKSLSHKTEQLTETPKGEKKENLISPSSIRTYKIELPSVNSVASFIYFGNPTSLFNPLNAYFLTEDNKVVGVPFYVSATNSYGNPWCFGLGKDQNTVSYDQNSMYCVESVNDKELIVRRLDLRGREYKEFTFSQENGLFSAGQNARVIASRDGDTAFIYSSFGAYIFESTSGNLFPIDMPSNVEILKPVYLSNVEAAFITTTNKIYRINFSSHKGGLFDVNFSGLDNTKLTKGLKTARLSKDSRRIIFTISDLTDEIQAATSPDYQTVIAYNIALDGGKVFDELDREEKFLVSCKNLVDNKYCLYKSLIGEEKNKQEFLYLKEYDLPLVEVAKAKSLNNEYKIATYSIIANPNYFFVKVPIFNNPQKAEEFSWNAYSYNTTTKTLKPLAF